VSSLQLNLHIYKYHGVQEIPPKLLLMSAFLYTFRIYLT